MKTNSQGKIIYPDAIHETVVEYIKGDKTITVSSTDVVWAKRIKKLWEQDKDNISIVENEDGSVCAHFPKEYFKLSKPRSRSGMSEEQKQAAAERLKMARAKRVHN